MDQSYNRPAAPVSKNKYFATLATDKTKKTAKLAWIVAVVCVAVMILGYIVTLNTSFEDIPFISLLVDEDEVDEMMDELEESADEIDDLLDRYEDELDDLSNKEEKALDNLVDATKDISKTLSISNLQRMAKAMEALEDTDVGELLGLSDSNSGTKEAMAILSVVSGILLWMMICTLVFTVLGALLRGNVLVILGTVFTTIYCLTFCGILFVILNLAAHITLCVLHRQINAEYKAYKSGTRAA